MLPAFNMMEHLPISTPYEGAFTENRESENRPWNGGSGVGTVFKKVYKAVAKKNGIKAKIMVVVV
jgi:hypothetical protein